MTREEALELEVQALKDLVNIQKQIIEALKLKAEVLAQPIVQPLVAPYMVPYTPPAILQPLPWPGYPAPYVGDVPPGTEPFKVTCDNAPMTSGIKIFNMDGSEAQALPGVFGGFRTFDFRGVTQGRQQ